MSSTNLSKKIFILGFLLIVLAGIFAWQAQSMGNGYFGWLKLAVSKINPLEKIIGSELNLSRYSGLDLSNVNIEELINEKKEIEKIEEIVEIVEIEETKKEPVFNEPLENGIGGPIKPDLEEIQQEINRIAEEVDRIDKEVQNLVALKNQS